MNNASKSELFREMADLDGSTAVDLADFSVIGTFRRQCNNPQDASSPTIAF